MQLQQVAADDNGCGDQSWLTFMASAGVTYRIDVDGANGATGYFELGWGLGPSNGFAAAPPPPSLQGTIGNGVVTFTVNAADLGLAPSGGFNILALSGNTVIGELDTAPDIRTFNYQLVAGTPPPPLGPDTRAPLDRAFASRGVHGKSVHLDYWAADGRGVTVDTLRVYRRARLLRTIRISLGDASPFLTYYGV